MTIVGTGFRKQSNGAIVLFQNGDGITSESAMPLSQVQTYIDSTPTVVKVASANIRNSNDANDTSTSATYVKVKTINLDYGLLGVQRFLFDIDTDDVLATVYGKIYRNGVALGTEQSTASLTPVTKSEDITQDWNWGDACELWVHSDGVATVTVSNFRIAYDNVSVDAVPSFNS